jgi:hypothetical protein
MPAREPANHLEHSPAELIDRLIAGQQPALCLVHEPEGPAHRDLPVGQALEVAAELCLAQVRVGLELGRVRKTLVDQTGRLDGSRERAVDDAPDLDRAQGVSDGRRLRPP